MISIPQEKTIAEGSDLILTVQAEGQVFAQGFIHLRSQVANPGEKIELLREDPRNFPYSMNNVDESFEYFFEIGDAFLHSMENPEQKVVSPPRVIHQELTVTPPKYTDYNPHLENLAVGSSSIRIGTCLGY